MPGHRPIISSAKLIAVCTFSSRITGLVRDMLLLHSFGAAWVLDAFFYGFQFPNLFRRLFGEGALAAVFVPTFTRVLEHDGRPAAWRLLARTLGLLTVTVTAVIVLIEAIILLIWVLSPAEPSRQLILALTALMLPFMLTICVVALLASILNCLGSFVPAALTPVILNVVMIVGIVGLAPLLGTGPERQIFAVAASVLVAGLLQLLLLVGVLRRLGVTVACGWRPRDPLVAGMLTRFGPVLLGQGVLLFGVFLDAQICALLTHVRGGPPVGSFFGLSFAYPLQEGALSALTVAQRLYQFPLGVFGISLAVAALPALSRLAARQDWPGWARELTGTFRLAVFAGLLAGAMMIVLAEPIVRLLFEYREFDAAATRRAGRVLMFYGFGLWAFCAQHIVLRGFYSLGNVRTPVVISCSLLPLNLALSLVLIWFEQIREAAFAISTTLTATIGVLVGLLLLRREVDTRLLGAATFWAVGRMLGAAVVCALVVAWVRSRWLVGWAESLGPTVIGRAIETLGSLALGSASFLLLSALLRLPETRLLLRRAPAGRSPAH